MAVDTLRDNDCKDTGDAKSKTDDKTTDDFQDCISDVGCPRMTPELLQEICVKGQGFRDPTLNEGLLLHYKGFRRVANLEPYVNVRTIWLECNGLARIEGVSTLKNLMQLYLHSNCIKRIENLDGLTSLRLLNLSNNSITRVENLETLHNLENINLSGNKLVDVEGLEGFRERPTLRNVNISRNYVEDGEAYVAFWQTALPEVQCLYLHQNPCSRMLKDYRRRMVSSLKDLKWLDERPVWEFERVGAEAWAIGGREAEKEAQKNHILKEREDKEKSFNNFKRVSAAAAARFSAQRQAQEALNSAREEATAHMHETGDLADGWTMLESRPAKRVTSSAMEDPSDQPELHDKVQSFLASRSQVADAKLAGDTSAVGEGSGGDLPATEREEPREARTESSEPKEDSAADDIEVETTTEESACPTTAGSTDCDKIADDTVEEEFVWTRFKEKRLERLVAQNHWKFDKVAPLLTAEFGCPVSAAACREQYHILLKPGSRPLYGNAPGGNRARDVPDLAPADLKEVTNWWVKQIVDGAGKGKKLVQPEEKPQGRKGGTPHIFEAAEPASTVALNDAPEETVPGSAMYANNPNAFGGNSLAGCLGNMDMYAAFAPPSRVKESVAPEENFDRGADETVLSVETLPCTPVVEVDRGTPAPTTLGSELFELD